MTASFYSTYKIKGDPYLRLDADRVVFASDRGEDEGRSDFWEDDTGYIRVDATGKKLKCTPGKSIPCGNACVPAMRGGKKIKCSSSKAKTTSIESRQSFAEAMRAKKGLATRAEVSGKRSKLPETERKTKTGKTGVAKSTSARNKPTKITKQSDFEKLAAQAMLDLEKTEGSTVPIYKLREKLGGSVSRSQFNNWIQDMQKNGILYLQTGEGFNVTGQQRRNSLTNPIRGFLFFASIDDEEKAKKLVGKDSKSLQEKLLKVPKLDPNGAATEIAKRKPIKNHAAFESELKDALNVLNDEFNYAGVVPVSHVRKALEKRSNGNFDDWVTQSLRNGQVKLGQSDANSRFLKDNPGAEEGAIDNPIRGKLHYFNLD